MRVILVYALASRRFTIQTPTQANDLPFLSISIPPTVPSETVQISYYLVGPFGGHGSYVTPQLGLSSYRIPATVDGKAATEIRAIVYASGCEIQKFTIPLTDDSRVNQEFPCQRVEAAKVSGRIVPIELARRTDAELIITYMAHWAHSFFHIVDGPVTQFRVAATALNADGAFELNLPLLREERTQSEFCFMLRDAKTWNPIVYNLEPDLPELRSYGTCLRLQNSYPSNINFAPSHFEESSQRQGDE